MSEAKKKFQPSEIEALKEVLENLKPEPKALGVSDTIKKMADLIIQKRNEGVSEQQIRAAFASKGLNISITTYRNALKAESKKKSSTQPKNKKKTNTRTTTSTQVMQTNTLGQLNSNLQDEALS